MNPFLILHVPLDATDEQVRAAYRAAVQEAPPERNPERFQAVQEAWTKLRDERSRWKSRLLQEYPVPDTPLEALLAYSRLPGQAQPLGVPAFRAWLQTCAAPEIKSSAAPAPSAFAGRSSQPKRKKKR